MTEPCLLHEAIEAQKRAGAAFVARPKNVNTEQILKLRKDGLSHRQIAERLGISTWSVHNALK